MKKIRLILTLLFSVSYLLIYAQTPFGKGNLLVLRAGNGTTFSSTASVPISAIEYDKTGNVIQTVNIPATGASKTTLSTINTGTKEGFLSISDDDNYVTFAGYDAEVGTTNVQSSSGGATGILRTIGQFDASGNYVAIKGGTFPGGSNSGVRTAVQVDGDRAWAAGSANYLRYVPTDGGTATSTWSTSAHKVIFTNKLAIYNNQIYLSSDGSTTNGLWVINTNNNRFPVSSTSAIPTLLDIPGLGSSPNGFVFFDTTEDGIPDLLYVADGDVAVGLQKFYFDGTAWAAKGKVQAPDGLTEKELRDVTGVFENGVFSIYSNTASDVLLFTDTALPNTDIVATGQSIATAGTNYVFRGVSFTPGTKKAFPRPESYGARIKSNTELIGNITSNVTYRNFPGLEETHITYTDKVGKPMVLFFATVDLANPNIKLEAGMKNGGTAYGVQRVTDQITYKNTANAPDFKVLAATNGDYWDIAGQYPQIGTPLGTVYMNGTMVKEFDKEDHFFLSIQKNNTAIIGNFAKYNNVKADINWALGGRFHVVRQKDEYIPSGTTDTGLNPRTVVGTLSPTKLIFAVIDGRRSTYSIGLTLTETASLYRALGAVDVLNLDGGGSSTFVTKDAGDNNNYQVRNSPSDGSPRSVANSWMILGRTNPVTPVKLKSFSAQQLGENVRLNWTTVSETNNSHFEIYRSEGKEFSLPIATVQGAGNSNTLKNYSYTDHNPFKGINYYQLNQVDYDGKSEKSNIVAVNTGIDGNQFVLYKSEDQLHTTIHATKAIDAKLKVTDISGRTISEINVKLQKGQNNVQLPAPKLPGVYIATLYMEAQAKSLKFNW